MAKSTTLAQQVARLTGLSAEEVVQVAGGGNRNGSKPQRWVSVIGANRTQQGAQPVERASGPSAMVIVPSEPVSARPLQNS